LSVQFSYEIVGFWLVVRATISALGSCEARDLLSIFVCNAKELTYSLGNMIY